MKLIDIMNESSMNEAPYKQPDKKLVKVVKGTVGAVQNDMNLLKKWLMKVQY